MSPELIHTLGRIRLAAHKTQEEMGGIVGLERPSISRIEGGSRTTTVDVLETWAAACGYRVELVRESDTILSTPGLTPEHRALVDRLTRLLPETKESQVEMLEDIVDAVERRKGRDK